MKTPAEARNGRPERPRLVVGIDPGLRTGVAVYSVERESLQSLSTLDFWSVIEFVPRVFGAADTLVVVEDCSLNKPTFRKSESRRKQDRLSRDVGAVQRESQLLAEGLERAGFTVHRERPTQSKWDEKTFRRATRWAGGANQHEIDAARLCWKLGQWPLAGVPGGRGGGRRGSSKKTLTVNG